MKFYTAYDRPEHQGEVNVGPSKVEKVGYVPSNILIENMIFAGMRLNRARTEAYDVSPDEIDKAGEVPIDPTRNPGFDMADASLRLQNLKNRMLEQKELFAKEEAKRILAEEEKKKEFELWKKEQEEKKQEVKND